MLGCNYITIIQPEHVWRRNDLFVLAKTSVVNISRCVFHICYCFIIRTVCCILVVFEFTIILRLMEEWLVVISIRFSRCTLQQCVGTKWYIVIQCINRWFIQPRKEKVQNVQFSTAPRFRPTKKRASRLIDKVAPARCMTAKFVFTLSSQVIR